MERRPIAIGIDIGGSHISCGAVDLNVNQLIEGTCFEAKVDNKASAEEILCSWVGAIQKTMDVVGKETIAGIGFAMPGPFDYLKGIGLFEGNEKYLNLYGCDVCAEMKVRLLLDEFVQVRFINDATAFAVSEAWIGVGQGVQRIIALTLGTGFGSAFIDGGIPVVQGHEVPESGCVWYLPFGEGIADEYFSTRWFEKSYLKLTGKPVNGVKQLSDLCEKDEVAQQLFAEFGTNMGNFMAPWIKKFDAGLIVLGGNITGAYDKFGSYLQQSLENNNVHAGIYISELKENAAIIGSARLIDDEFYAKIEPLL